MQYIKKLFLFLFIFLLAGSTAAQSNDLSNKRKYWVFFQDKGPGTVLEKNGFNEGLQLGISHRALVRRAKVRPKTKLLDATDLPVLPEYIQIIKGMGLKPLVVSRWLNGISVVIPSNLVKKILSLPFVKKVQPVAHFYLKPYPEEKIHKRKLIKQLGSHNLDYGMSYEQNNMIHVPEVHDIGINGKGVLVGMLDTGFDYKNRTVFQNLHVVAEHDFQWDDDITANQENDPYGQDQHGTMTLSVIAGFDQGNLIGPAYGSSFVLAKTEWVATETRIEEDHWVAGIEWMEKLGVDVVSSSLGYGVFDDSSGYTYEDLNGDKCVTTIAADIAASKGVVVVNSAGNRDFWPPHIDSPADGDSVIAVGAVDSQEHLAGFSSVGPTADGRFKPDVVAMGVGVCAVNPARDSKTGDYVFVNGTSFSCPLVAGVCALVLQAHPELGPMEVRDAIRETAKRIPVGSHSINNQYGWGLVDAYRAIFYHGMIFTNFKKISLISENLKAIDVDVLSRTGIEVDSLFLFYRIGGTEEFHKIKLVYQGGETSANFRAKIPLSVNLGKINFYIQALDTLGTEHTGPVGAPNVLYSFSDTSSNIVFLDKLPKEFHLYQNYPNPFNSTTTITFDLSERTHVKIIIYNILGQKVITLVDRILDPGKQEVIWNGIDRFGQQVVSGLYFYQLKTDNGVVETHKMILSK